MGICASTRSCITSRAPHPVLVYVLRAPPTGGTHSVSRTHPASPAGGFQVMPEKQGPPRATRSRCGARGLNQPVACLAAVRRSRLLGRQAPAITRLQKLRSEWTTSTQHFPVPYKQFAVTRTFCTALHSTVCTQQQPRGLRTAATARSSHSSNSTVCTQQQHNSTVCTQQQQHGL
jgi:hypothetical protein